MTNLKYQELAAAIETQNNFKELAQDAAQRSRLSKSLGFAGIGVVAPYVIGVSISAGAQLLALDWSKVHEPALLLFFAASTVAVVGSEAKAVNIQRKPTVHLQFDDMETFEHTKCKPISISIAVEERSRWILGFELAKMPCKGRLAKKSLKKYGKREDQRTEARQKLFISLSPYLAPTGDIKSDENPHYINDIRSYFPNFVHERVPAGRSASTGQGELKKKTFDPIFSFNHTAAMVRYRMSRMIRKTWCTSKKMEGLRDHLSLMVLYHNLSLLPKPTS